MPPPREPIDIPSEAIAALRSLRAAFAPSLSERAEFGVGFKQAGGDYLDQLALIVFVPEKLPLDRLAPEQVIPTAWYEQGVMFVTDVQESNPTLIGLVNDSNFYNPLWGGIEIGTLEQVNPGAFQPHTGTLGCVVQRRSDGARGLLTCHHVAPMGLEVWQAQEGQGQGAFRASIVGKVVKAIPHLQSPWWDCALIEPNGTRGIPEPRIQDIGPVKGSAKAERLQLAKKRGRTTGLTTGPVVAVVFDDQTLGLSRMILDTDPPGGLFCWHGDSGSAVLNVSHEVIGLLYSMDQEAIGPDGTPIRSRGVARPIQPILDQLNIEIAVSPPVITQIQPNTALSVLANGGWTQIEGWGFDAGAQVTFGGAPALAVMPVSPRRLIVTPPVQILPGQTVDVIVTNAQGEPSLPGPTAGFAY